MKLTTGYAKPIDSNDYVLLAGGGHKALNEFLSSDYKTLVDYYASTLFTSTQTFTDSWYYFDLTSTKTINVTVNGIKYQGNTITATDKDIVKMSASSNMSSPITLTRNGNDFTGTFTIPANPGSSYTRYFTITHDGITSGVISKSISRNYKVYYGKSTTTSLANANAAKTLLGNLSYTHATSKGSTVTVPAGNGTSEYWWFATPWDFTEMQNTTTYETSGATKIGSFSINFGTDAAPNNVTYYFWKTTSLAATVSQNWKVGI